MCALCVSVVRIEFGRVVGVGVYTHTHISVHPSISYSSVLILLLLLSLSLFRPSPSSSRHFLISSSHPSCVSPSVNTFYQLSHLGESKSSSSQLPFHIHPSVPLITIAYTSSSFFPPRHPIATHPLLLSPLFLQWQTVVRPSVCSPSY